METRKLQASIREEIGKKSTKKLKREGLVPAELYGGEKNLHIAISEKELTKLTHTPNVFIIDLEVDGTTKKAIIQDVQYHPVNDNTLHVDFKEVIDEKPVTVKVPVTISGNSIGIMNGGKLRLVKRYLKITGKIEDLPETLDIDITKLKIGDSIKVSELSYNNIMLLDPQNALVVAIISSRASRSAAASGEDVGAETKEETAESATEQAAPAE